MTEEQLYQEYLDDFDPTPIYNGEDYLTPMSFDHWLEHQMPEDSRFTARGPQSLSQPWGNFI